jgi:hypothetical protein
MTNDKCKITNVKLHDLYFCGGDDLATAAIWQWRHVHTSDAPATVAQLSSERWFAGDIADQFDRRWIEARLDRHHLPLVRGDYRFQFEIMLDHLPATFMHIAHCGADLRILVWRYVLDYEIDKPPVALQQGEHLHGPIDPLLYPRLGLRCRSLSGNWRRDRRGRFFDYLRRYLRRYLTSGEYREKAPKSV